jgi:flagellar biosynthesis protein FlhG
LINGDILMQLFKDIIIENDFDVIILDTPAAGSNELLQFCNFADLMCLVINDEPTSLLDAYGLIKILLQFFGKRDIVLLANNVIDADDAIDITKKLNLATNKFLKINLDVLGYIPYDRTVRQSIMHQEPFIKYQSESEASKAVNNIAEKLLEKILVLE